MEYGQLMIDYVLEYVHYIKNDCNQSQMGQVLVINGSEAWQAFKKIHNRVCHMVQITVAKSKAQEVMASGTSTAPVYF